MRRKNILPVLKAHLTSCGVGGCTSLAPDCRYRDYDTPSLTMPGHSPCQSTQNGLRISTQRWFLKRRYHLTQQASQRFSEGEEETDKSFDAKEWLPAGAIPETIPCRMGLIQWGG
jgi:hypothetical protein